MKLSALSRSEKYFNLAATISLIASITLWFAGAREEALFVGLWVPSIIGWMNFTKLKDAETSQRRRSPAP